MRSTEEPKKQILIVEDEGLIADDLQRQLQRRGYAVAAIANSGEDALQVARSTPCDLVLMDIRLKGRMDGITTAGLLQEESRIPVIYLTGLADHETMDRAMRTEPAGFVVKPIGEEDLGNAVERALYKHEMDRRSRARRDRAPFRAD